MIAFNHAKSWMKKKVVIWSMLTLYIRKHICILGKVKLEPDNLGKSSKSTSNVQKINQIISDRCSAR